MSRIIAKKWARQATFSIGLILFSLLSVELLASFFLYIIEPKLYQGTAHINPIEEEKDVFSKSPLIMRHPYFGYVRAPSQGVNNYGFETPHELPYKKAENDFVIAVFGGSVANGMAHEMQKSNFFIKQLKKQIPQLKHKNVVLLNLALAGYKQPQQFYVSTYFLESFDLAINLDGHNELFFSPYPVFPNDYPLWSQILFSGLDNFNLKLGLIRSARALVRKIYKIQESIYYKSALVKLTSVHLIKFAHQYIVNIHHQLANQKQKGIRRFNKHVKQVDHGDIIPKAAQTWSKYTSLQYGNLKQRGIKSLFFIQPSQYLKGTKPLGPAEQKMAIQANRVTDVEKGYELLFKRAHKLRKQGIPIVDLTHVFKHVHEPLYTDTCCHFNAKGNRLVAKAIISHLANNTALFKRHK